MKEFRKKLYRLIALLCPIIACLILGISCKKNPEPTEVSEAEISATAIELTVGESYRLSISNVTENVVWKNNAEEIVEVTEDGTVTALAWGNALVTAQFGNKEMSCEVQVVKSKTGTDKLYVDASFLNESKRGEMIVGQSYNFEVNVYNGKTCVALPASDCRFVYNDEYLEVTVNNGKAEISAKKAGAVTFSCVARYNGNELQSDEYNLSFTDKRVLRVTEKVPVLLTNKSLSGKTNTSMTSYTFGTELYNPITGESETPNNDELKWSSSDESIAIAESGRVTAIKSGDVTVTVSYKTMTLELPLRVYSPIFSAEDLDALSLVTYYQRNNEEQAKATLDGYYLLVNDIDYAKHTRNYMLPIASVTLGSVNTNDYATVAYSSNTTSYYSLGWKNILSLSEKENDGSVYLVNSDETEFCGINPKGLSFTGIIDGNGYAIKNAWFMYDNILGYHYTGGWVGSYASMIGLNEGTIQNIFFDRINMPNAATQYRDGKYYEGNNPSAPDAIQNVYFDGVGKIASTDKERNVKFNDGKPWGMGEEPSAMVIVNSGVIQNVKYSAIVTTRGSMHNNYKIGNGLTMLNRGKITHNVVDIGLKYKFESVVNTANTAATFNLYGGEVSYTYSVITDLRGTSGDTLNCFGVYKNEGTVYGECRIYSSAEELNGCCADVLSSSVWKKAGASVLPELRQNIYGITL